MPRNEPKPKTYRIEVSSIWEVCDLEKYGNYSIGCSNKEIEFRVAEVRKKLNVTTPLKTLLKAIGKEMGIHTVSELEGITITPFRDVYHAMNKVFFNKESLWD
jgi:hypothetical protein